MAPRARKRIHGFRRGPDGSAFDKCESCGVSVAIALFDMHECGRKFGGKRRRVGTEGLGIQDQPRSPFCCFMENFKQTCKAEKWIEVDRRGFETWKNMSKTERNPYIVQAKRVNSAYLKVLQEEINAMSKVDDEADSAMVGKFDLTSEDRECSLSWGSLDPSNWEEDLEFTCSWDDELDSCCDGSSAFLEEEEDR